MLIGGGCSSTIIPNTVIRSCGSHLVWGEKRLLVLTLMIMPIMLYLLYKSVIATISIDNLALYRSLAIGSVSQESVIFGSKYIKYFYVIFVKTFIYTILIIGFVIFVKRGINLILVLSIAYLIIDSIIMLGRFNLLYIFVFYILATSLRSSGLINNFKKYSWLFFALFILFYLITFLRDGANHQSNVIEIVTNHLALYFTMAFSIFDIELNNNNSLLNNFNSFGLSSLGSFGDVFFILFKIMGADILPPGGVVGAYLQSPFIIGYDDYSNPITGNAFGGILYSLYLDGGVVGIILFGFFYGFFLVYNLKSLKYNNNNNNNDNNYFYIFFLIYIGVAGFFQPILTGNWLIMMSFYFFISIYLRHKMYRARNVR